MSKKRLLINLPPAFFESELMKSRFDALKEEYDVRTSSHNTHEEIHDDLEWAEAVMMWSWPVFRAEEFDYAKNLQFLAQINTTITTATEALKRNISMSEVRHCWSPAVSEMALTLILSGLRLTSNHHMKMRMGTEEWVDAFPTDIDPRERQLAGLKVGIVGFGRVGQGLCNLLKPFNNVISIYDPYLPDAVAEQYGVAKDSVENICAENDVIVLCAANTPEAEHLIKKEHIDSMKENSILVNVGRSMLIDMDALLERLQKNDMIAMLDVFDQEPLEKDSLFRKLENAYLTPHRAGGIYESVYRSIDCLAEDMRLYFAGKDEERKYRVTESQLPCFCE